MSTFERFHIPTKNAPLERAIPRIFVERKDQCVNCGICVTACVYGVHERKPAKLDPTRVAEPVHAKCVACHRCVNECPMEALELRVHPEQLALGDEYYTPERIRVLMKEAETGRVPVSGQGYRGPFAGPGFDGIWTDMSEIVRPTRDGIHGRESISTEVELGRRPPRLRFDEKGLADYAPKTHKIAIPLFLIAPSQTDAKLRAMFEQAAKECGTFVLGDKHVPVETIPLSPKASEQAVQLAEGGAAVLHLVADKQGRAEGGTPLVDALREVDEALVRAGLRDGLSLLVSGGICMAEHLPKAMICGGDAVGLDQALLLALGASRIDGPVAVEHTLGVQRLKNLLSSWRDQLLEVLGAMGIREASRLQGETGRAMFQRDLEKEFREALAAKVPLPSNGTVSDGSLPETVAVQPAPSEIWRKVPKYRVGYTKDCIDCGLCMLACPHDVHQREPGKLRMSVPDSFACIGPICESKHPLPSKEAAHVSPAKAGAQTTDVRLDSGLRRNDGAQPSEIFVGYCVPQCPFDAIQIEKNPEWETLGDPRWSGDLLFATWYQAENARIPKHGDWDYAKGRSGGGFDLLDFRFSKKGEPQERELFSIDTSIELNRRSYGPKRTIPVPWYGGGMSYGSVGLPTMLSRARAAKAWNTYTSTGEGGYPPELLPYKDNVITQVATGMFGVREDTIAAGGFVEIKYAQGAKPGLGGHLLSDKNTQTVADLRETSPGISLFSPFPFHSVYSVEDHRKHVDWIHATADAVRLDLDAVQGAAGDCGVLVSAKVSTPSDVDMVAVGCYYGGVNVIHLDGSYGGTGAAPDIAKKNIAMPIEYAIPKVHRFLVAEGIRDEVVLIASGGLRSAHDIAKAIALGADGVVLGTSDLVAVNCTRCGNCESGRGCQHGIATTDPVLTKLWTHDWGAQRIINLYYSYRMELALLLWRLGLRSIRELRGRTDMLNYSPENS